MTSSHWGGRSAENTITAAAVKVLFYHFGTFKSRRYAEQAEQAEEAVEEQAEEQAAEQAAEAAAVPVRQKLKLLWNN